MSVVTFEYAQHIFQLAFNDQFNQSVLAIDGHVVSQQDCMDNSGQHVFNLENGECYTLNFSLVADKREIHYRLWQQKQCVAEAVAELLPTPLPENILPVKPAVATGSKFSLLLVVLKLLKTAKVIKVALASATLAVYSVMFTLEFAIALISILVFHEYGHLRAMKKFGIPTKGMYLIPFVGGMAVGDKPKSQWQDVYISMMGPVYGLAMTLFFYLAYLLTGNHFAGLVASTSALINLFNLIPVYPLDGGRIVKALVFSGRNYWALVILLIISALCFVLAWQLGFYFIVFFIVLGVFDILGGWRIALANDITPLKRYGIVFSVCWYLGVVGLFMGMIILIAKDKLPGAEIAIKVLSS